jgi:DivIVA domain-containing protein
MELDRRDIEKTDFPQARRGYDPAAVDSHLRGIAQAVEELKRSRAQSSSSLAGAAAERVEAIVGAAEASAREIEERAQADAAERVRRAEAAVEELLGRTEALKAEVDDFVARMAGFKTSIEQMRADFDSGARPDPAATAVLEPVSVPVPRPEPILEPEPEPALEPEPESAPEPEPAPAPQPVATAAVSSSREDRSSEGARLIALNMALSGAPRDETARYLRENFDLSDQDDLLDDVYARAGS